MIVRIDLRRIWCEQQGSSVAQAAGVAILVSILVTGLLLGARLLGPAIVESFNCVVMALEHGESCDAGNSAPLTPDVTNASFVDIDGRAPELQNLSVAKRMASFVADITPVLGEAKGFIELFTGKDLVTDEELGAWRFAGIFGIVGINEIKLLRYGDDVAHSFHASSKVTKGAGALTRRIAGTHGLQHSFDKHAAQWFGRVVPARTHMAQWQNLIEKAAQSRSVFDWDSKGTPTVAHLARIERKYFVVQFHKEGARAGELATAFVPKQNELTAILKRLGH